MSGRAISRVLAKYRSTPFEWGKIDCMHFAFECAAAAGRRDLRRIIPPYENELGAARAMRRLGFMSLLDAMDAHATPIRGAVSLPGDVAYLYQPGMGALGAVVGAKALFLAEGGFLELPAAPLDCWRLD